MKERIPVVLTQILSRTLYDQSADGSWGLERSPEVTAYGILTLKALSSLPWYTVLHEETAARIRSGQILLSQVQTDWAKPVYIWIEKVTYGSARLSEAYCLAAVKASHHFHSWTQSMSNLMEIPEQPISKLTKTVSSLKRFQEEPIWKLKVSAVESHVFLPKLKSTRSDILPREQGAKNEYLAYVPFTWILINNVRNLDLCANLL